MLILILLTHKFPKHTIASTETNYLHYKLSHLLISPLVPDAHYSERQDKPFSLQIQQLEVVDLKLNYGLLFFAPQELMG